MELTNDKAIHVTMLNAFPGAGKKTLLHRVLNGRHGVLVVFLVACFACIAAVLPAAGPPDASSTQWSVFEPPKTGGPVVVHTSFELLSMSAINDEAETFHFSGVLTLVWKDARQAFDPVKEGAGEKVFSGAYQFNEISPGWYPQVTLANAAGQYDSRAVTFRVKPDGTSTLSETLEAIAKVHLNLRRYPFDHQRMEAVFRVFGFDTSEVVLETEAKSASAEGSVATVPQWTLKGVEASTRTMHAPTPGGDGAASTFVVSMDVKRNPFFMLRLVVIPLFFIVMLSWSVFWMDRSSLGDRMGVSFVGILTAVAYQIVLVGTLPSISYVTLLNAFVIISSLIMSATVVINLVVGAADRRGHQTGERIDRRCRWIFPLTYIGLNALAFAVAFLLF